MVFPFSCLLLCILLTCIACQVTAQDRLQKTGDFHAPSLFFGKSPLASDATARHATMPKKP